MTAAGDDNTAAGGSLTCTIVPEHHVVRAENARITALNLRFLNLNCLVGMSLHEIVLTGRVRPQGRPVGRAALFVAALTMTVLSATHYLNAAGDLGAMAVSRLSFLRADQATSHARPGKNFA